MQIRPKEVAMPSESLQAFLCGVYVMQQLQETEVEEHFGYF